jgi:hypothetical protein
MNKKNLKPMNDTGSGCDWSLRGTRDRKEIVAKLPRIAPKEVAPSVIPKAKTQTAPQRNGKRVVSMDMGGGCEWSSNGMCIHQVKLVFADGTMEGMGHMTGEDIYEMLEFYHLTIPEHFVNKKKNCC